MDYSFNTMKKKYWEYRRKADELNSKLPHGEPKYIVRPIEWAILPGSRTKPKKAGGFRTLVDNTNNERLKKKAQLLNLIEELV